MGWAACHRLYRLELTVMAHDHRAISLYERMGCTGEGRRKQCPIVRLYPLSGAG